MTKIVEIAIIIFVVWVILCAVSLVLRRIRLYRLVNRLGREYGASVKYLKLPFLSLFKLSSAPELAVRLGKRLYLLRIFNGGGIGKVVHFASEAYAVRFSRLRTAAYVKRKTHEKIVTARSGFAVGTKVISVPRLDVSNIVAEEGITVVPAIIFNPAPGEVSYVTEEKTSIRVAFTGDDVLGTRIFTASTFLSYAEREYRREKREETLSDTKGTPRVMRVNEDTLSEASRNREAITK